MTILDSGFLAGRLLATARLLVLVPVLLIGGIGVALGEGDKDEAVAELEKSFLQSAKQYQVFAGDSKKPLTLVEQPILNWTNPERKTPAGAIFIWLHANRPLVAMCVYPNEDTLDHEFQSLSVDNLRVELGDAVPWRPSEPGLAFASVKVPGDASSTPSAPVRLRHMKFIARTFSATVGASEDNRKSLRLLNRPIFRYPASGGKTDVVDGAVFAFVQGTDPEVLVVVEGIKDSSGNGLRWQYALARMSMVPLQVSRNGNPVWEKNWGGGNPEGAYYTIHGQ